MSAAPRITPFTVNHGPSGVNSRRGQNSHGAAFFCARPLGGGAVRLQQPYDLDEVRAWGREA
jgi:hypothetical protein